MPDSSPLLEVKDLSITVHGKQILKNINFRLQSGEVLGLVGPSGAGKSTLLRSLNRLLELQPGYKVQGSILLHGQELLSKEVDADALRERIGMVFQQPAVFPTSISENVLFGAKRLKKLSKPERVALVESSLKSAALWEEVKDRLSDSALRLSIGQQQRLCIARTLATDPEIILMDEPTSALDPKASEAVEASMARMKEKCSLIIVTHNLAQARRVTDWVTCLCADEGYGEVIESACCDAFFSSASCQRVFATLDGATEPSVARH